MTDSVNDCVLFEILGSSALNLLSQQNGGAYNRGPEAILISLRRLRNVSSFHDLSRDFPDLFFLVVALVRVERNTQRRGKHRRGKVLRVVSSLFVRLTIIFVFREVAVRVPVLRNS